jgi:hypothetical protein
MLPRLRALFARSRSVLACLPLRIITQCQADVGYRRSDADDVAVARPTTSEVTFRWLMAADVQRINGQRHCCCSLRTVIG